MEILFGHVTSTNESRQTRNRNRWELISRDNDTRQWSWNIPKSLKIENCHCWVSSRTFFIHILFTIRFFFSLHLKIELKTSDDLDSTQVFSFTSSLMICQIFNHPWSTTPKRNFKISTNFVKICRFNIFQFWQ